MLLVSGSYAQDQILGTYFTPQKDGKIQIVKVGSKYVGKILPTQNNTRKDVHNPDVKLRNRDLGGLEILSGFEFKDGKWINGTIYDPDNGKTYDCILSFDGDLSKLNVRGFVGFSMFGRTEIFERVK